MGIVSETRMGGGNVVSWQQRSFDSCGLKQRVRVPPTPYIHCATARCVCRRNPLSPSLGSIA
eukprot:5434044-Amphidinium_carterae.1